jgi:23S rRNA pseudouridine2605 synthase
LDTEANPPLRLQKYLAEAGVASRRASEQLILDGRVTVNGVVVTTLGTRVGVDALVTLDGNVVKRVTEHRYVLLHKPPGYVSTMADEEGRPIAASLLPEKYAALRLYNVGRLDMWSAGLLLFTNDGDFAQTISHPGSRTEKEYVVETSPVNEETLRLLAERFAKGFSIDGIRYKAEKMELLGPRTIKIVLLEGKNREIRRIFSHFEVPIKRLTRTRIGSVTLGNLREGECRELTEKERQTILFPCTSFCSPASPSPL